MCDRYDAHAEQFAVDGDDNLNYVIGGTQYHPSYGAIYKWFVLRNDAGTLILIANGTMNGDVNDLDSSPDAACLAFGSDAGEFILLERTDDTVEIVFNVSGLQRIDAIEVGSNTLLVGGDYFIHIYTSVLEANVTIKPETLNLNSKGLFTAFITLPEPYNIADIDISTVVCEGAPAVEGMVADDNKYIAKFDREDLREDLPTGDEVEMTVTGKLFDGTPFEGSDTIRVIDKGKGK